MTHLLEAQRVYQHALEAHRAHPDCEGTWQELQDAQRARDQAWVQAMLKAPTYTTDPPAAA
jgi:hypothetical protein